MAKGILTVFDDDGNEIAKSELKTKTDKSVGKLAPHFKRCKMRIIMVNSRKS